MTSREKKMMGGIIVVVILAAIGGAFWMGGTRGGDSTTATTATTATTPTQTVVTVTQTTATTSTDSAASTTTAVEVIDFDVNPETVNQGVPVVFTARTKGPAASVKLILKGAEQQTITLNQKPAVDGVTIWTATANAPTKPGPYVLSLEATATDGTVSTTPTGAGKNLVVLP